MRFTKLLLIGLMLLLAVGSFGMVVAQDAPVPATVETPVNLLIWHQERDEPVLTALQDAFQAWADQYAPGSTAEWVYYETEELRNQVLNAGLAGSGLPDLILGPNDPIGVYASAGVLQPVDSIMDLSVFDPSALEPAMLDGQLYGIPYFQGNFLMLMYNKDLVETPPDTWAEAIQMAKDIQAENPDIQGIAWNQNEPFWFLAFVHGFGGQVWDEEGNFVLDTQEWVDAYDFMRQLKFDDQILPAECDYNCMNSLFSEGSAAMIINGDWAISVYTDTAQAPAVGADKLGIAPWPALESGERPMPYVAGRYVSATTAADEADLAAIGSFLTYLSTSDEVQVALNISQGRIPATTAGKALPAMAENTILQESAAAMASGTGMPARLELRCMWDAVRPQLEGVMAGAVTPADAAPAAQDSAEACLEDFE